jgi:hypothetical protein
LHELVPIDEPIPVRIDAVELTAAGGGGSFLAQVLEQLGEFGEVDPSVAVGIADTERFSSVGELIATERPWMQASRFHVLSFVRQIAREYTGTDG